MYAPLRSSPKPVVTSRFRVMGGPAEIQIVPSALNATPQIDELTGALEREARRLEAKFSRYRTDSVTSSIKHATSINQPVTVDDECAALLSLAAQAFEATGGAFDITSGILRRAWRFEVDAEPPSHKQLSPLLAKIGWDRVLWRSPRLKLPDEEMELDFGGLVKEYAVDRLLAECIKAGVDGALVNLAGDIGAFSAPSYAGWRIGIVDPDEPTKALLSIQLRTGACVTSGDYERGFVHGGIRYHHILNPRTGYPERHFRSVTVLGPSATAAGIAATAGMLKGEDLLRELNVSAICIRHDRSVLRLEGVE